MKKWLKITLISLMSLIIVLASGFLLYVSDYYRADEAVAAHLSDDRLRKDGDIIILSPPADSGTTINGIPAGETALIFYPGGKVEYTAYIPILEKLSQSGITCVLVKMPFNLAVFDTNAADRMIAKLPEIKNWYIGGHSLGGAMASAYAAKHQDKIKGLVLLGAYIYGDIDPDRSITLYGSEDGVLDRTKITYVENVVVIQGGNHAQFGNYGEQKGDGTATISREDQQSIAVNEILEFLDR